MNSTAKTLLIHFARNIIDLWAIKVLASATFALLLSGTAAAASTILQDGTFAPAWTTSSYTTQVPGQVTAAVNVTGPYLDVTDTVAPDSGVYSTVYGVHTYPIPFNPGPYTILGIDFSIDYRCGASTPSCPARGQGFGPAVSQGGFDYVANLSGSVTGPLSSAWTTYAKAGLQETDFNLVKTGGTTDNTHHPKFDREFRCGFYTTNSTFADGYTVEAGYDNWSCTIRTPQKDSGQLKIYKVAGTGVAIGTPFTFNFTPSANPATVPAGPGPGGYCVLGPTFPVNTVVTVAEALNGYAVSSIAVAPTNRLANGPNLSLGTVGVTIGSGVTEVTYTNYQSKGYIEICKQGDVTGLFTFNVNPGNLGPFTIPAGTCTPAIQVTAGPVVITESGPGTIIACSTLPSSPCNFSGQTATVNVTAGDISAQTIVMITNRKGGPPPTDNVK